MIQGKTPNVKRKNHPYRVMASKFSENHPCPRMNPKRQLFNQPENIPPTGKFI